MCFVVVLCTVQLILLGVLVYAIFWREDTAWGFGRLRNVSDLRGSVRDVASAQAKWEREAIEKAQERFVDDWEKESSSAHFLKKLSSAIDYAIKRHDWYEEQRAKMFQASVAILTIVLTALTIMSRVGSLSAQPTAWLVAGLSAGCLLSMLRVAYLYNVELDADRPYRLISDIRFWYFRYNLPGQVAGGEVVDNKQAVALAQSVADQRKQFVERALSNAELVSSVREDLEQLFILQVLQHHKSESLKKLRHVLSFLLTFATVEAVLIISVQLFGGLQ
jgi:hypothetical protein